MQEKNYKKNIYPQFINEVCYKNDMNKLCGLILCVLVLVGCQRTTPLQAWLSAQPQPTWQTMNLSTNPFVLRSIILREQPHTVLHIYIEGDGHAWLRPSVQSPDPTPYHPLTLQLAAIDVHPQVAYLARPCQYTMPTHNQPACQKKYWGQARMAPEVIAAMHEAVNQLKQATGAQQVALFGYSGGGGVALLLAAQRDDVASIRTIAGNLDHAAFTHHHRLTPMAASLNPLDVAAQVAHIPQIHYAGEQDKVIPPTLTTAFTAALPQPHCARQVTLPQATHTTGWTNAWPRLLAQKPPCQNDAFAVNMQP